MALTYFRSPGSRIEHFVDPLRTTTLLTLCGRDARCGARFKASERGQDAKLRPLCTKCESALYARRATIDLLGA